MKTKKKEKSLVAFAIDKADLKKFDVKAKKMKINRSTLIRIVIDNFLQKEQRNKL